MNEAWRGRTYIGVRMLELLFVAAFVFGAMWEGAELLRLRVSQFLMLYGLIGMMASEAVARALQRRPAKVKFRPKAKAEA